MKIVVFAGGVGSRLWPLSRKHSPKQFEKIIGDKSVLQLTIDRILPIIKPSDIYISSGARYKQILQEQLSMIPTENFILEPVMRDVGAAVGLVSAILDKKSPDEPFIILWSDHLVKNGNLFRNILCTAGKILEREKEKIIFIGQNSRFASQNLGWIEYGDEIKTVDNTSIFKFISLHYRPELEKAEEFHKSLKHAWNPGYFATTPSFLLSLYRKLAPVMYSSLLEIRKFWKTDKFEEVLNKIYPTLEKISFDNLILEKIGAKEGYVIKADLGWSDVGAWESLKEALSMSENENVIKGKVLVNDCRDSLLFNYNDQTVVGIDLNQFLVVNTPDVLLVCPKNSVPKIKKLVESLAGTEHESLT